VKAHAIENLSSPLAAKKNAALAPYGIVYLRARRQFTNVNAPPLFGNTAPAICGYDAPLEELQTAQA